jgi:hypothetical protein
MRQREDAALPLTWTRERHVYRRSVYGGGDAVEAGIVQRAVLDRDSSDGLGAARNCR